MTFEVNSHYINYSCGDSDICLLQLLQASEVWLYQILDNYNALMLF